MKQCQNGNPVPHVMERGLSKAVYSSTVSRTNPKTGPPAVANYLIRRLRFACTIPLLIWITVRQSASTVSFQLPFPWIADGETCKVGLNSRSTLRPARILKPLLLQGRWSRLRFTNGRIFVTLILMYEWLFDLYTLWNPLYVFLVQNELCLLQCWP